jgi:beta-fructofuranosidase
MNAERAVLPDPAPDPAGDPSPASWRPRLHFTAPDGWINDPLGLTHHAGRYHLFFQHVPDRTVWATEQHWGHATSADLVHWTSSGIALSPGDGDDGVWSGSVVVPPDGPAAMFYTAVQRPDTHLGVARSARPLDHTWDTWLKGDVVAQAPVDLDLVAVRDPYVLHDGESWLMLLGAGLTDGTATALTYRSDDLERWRYTGLLAGRHTSEAEPWTGQMWECPQLFRVEDRWVLLVSVWSPTRPHDEAYAIGDLVDGRFVPEAWQRLTYGEVYYAGAAFTDAQGRPGLIHWLRGVVDPGGRWAGAHSLAHTVALDGGRLVASPHPAVAAMRTGPGVPVRAATLELSATLDLEWTLDDPAGTARLVLADAGGELLGIDVGGGSLAARTAQTTEQMPVTGSAVRVVVDGAIVEVFTTGGVMAVHLPRAAAALSVTASGSATLLAHRLD